MVDDNVGTPDASGLGRRSVLKGAVWSIPVIAAAVGTPLTAASAAARGKFAIESMLGGTWVNPQYYGASIQLRNDDTQAATLPVEPITSGVVTLTFAPADVGAIEPVIVANAGGARPVVGALPTTDPTWSAAGAVDNGTVTVTYTLVFAGSIAGPGVTHVGFGVPGSSPLHQGIPITVEATGSPTDGSVSSRVVTLF